MSIRALTEADAACGAKAIGLAKLIAAGLRVPEGFVIDRGAFDEVAALAQVAPEAVGHALADAERRLASAELPDALVREVLARAAALGRLAVRSSASVEDGELGSAAGVFSSLTDVAPEAVWEAVRAVWISALLPLAVSYARRHHAEIAIAVIIQRFVPGERMTVYTLPAGEPASDELWLSRGGAIERVPRSLADARPEAAIALAAEAAIGAARGADVELVLEPTPHGARVWIVQARPIVRPIARHRQPAPPMVVAALVQDGRRWTWDITHNPDPLSPAQAGLVEQVDRAAASPYALRVCGGYLYMTAGAPREPVAAPADRVELAARIAAIEGRLELGPAESPAAAVDRYVAFMRIWAGELSPLVSAARRRLLDRLAQQGHPAERIPALVAALVGPRRVPRDRVMAPAWDVAVPTFAELAATTDAGDARDAALARAATRPPPAEVPPELGPEVELARAAADAAEADDLWFARAQWMVRRALLDRSAALQLREGDIFWLPLEEVVAGRAFDPDDAHRRASAARAANQRAAGWDMPLVVDREVVSRELSSQVELTLRGVGLGPRVVGRVVRIASLTAVPQIRRGDIVVARAVTPALAMLVEGCAALVSETGGLLDHGAALARELGIPCVVGCASAWAQLTDGALVAVDGDAGLVERVGVAE